ncbi:hypothetical protein EDC04DRAFT_2865441 [Pisolithus marmoratus]|nr:hypothetical protein EDC04DRAFT_2865441 [Pisolithus marmoratus]
MPSYQSHLTVLEQMSISDPLTGRVHDWLPISYRQFKEDVEVTARHWCIPHGSVIGLWLSGMDYQDVLHIYGISRAGYVPQLFSIRLPNPVVVHELLREANARALILASEFAASTASFSPATLPPPTSSAQGNDLVFIFHTSGSTSGRPKLVPCNKQWLHSLVDKARFTTAPRDPQRQGRNRDYYVSDSSLATTSLTSCLIVLIGSLQHGTCTIQATKLEFSSDELLDMIQRLVLPLDRDDEDWAYKNGLRMKNLFGSTECGAMLLSVGGAGRDARSLRPLPGTSYKFVPISDQGSEGTHQSSVQFLELVILADSGDCPDSSLRSNDGHFHTGDLFQEATPWDDNVRSTCGDLIGECIVVGTGRPSPALLQREILRKTRAFHSRRYLHERITTSTKGNVRRKAVEELHKARLDEIYASLN